MMMPAHSREPRGNGERGAALPTYAPGEIRRRRHERARLLAMLVIGESRRRPTVYDRGGKERDGLVKPKRARL